MLKAKAVALAKKVLLVLPWLVLIALGVWFASNALAQWHYDTFTAPLVLDQKLTK